MTMDNINLTRAITAKMEYLTQKQEVISENIANADSPGYVANKLEDVDFGKMVYGGNAVRSIGLDTTNSMHSHGLGTTISVDEESADDVYEVAPAGNAVVIEEQLIDANKTMIDYTMMLNLYRKNATMMKTAIGTNSGK